MTDQLKDSLSKGFSRRDILKGSAVGAAALALAACSSGTSTSTKTSSSAAGGSTSAAAKRNIALKIGHSFPVDSLNHRTWLDLATNINKRTNDEVKIEVFANGTLGSDTELIAQLGLNAPLMIGLDYGAAAPYVPEFGAFVAPYNFISYAEGVKACSGTLFDSLAAKLADTKKWYFIATNWANGPRHLMSRSRDIMTPADTKGMKIRSPDVPVYVETFKAMGGSPTPLALAEVYSALSQGLVDGVDGFNSSNASLKLYEPCKHLSLTGHIWQMASVVGGSFFNSLPTDIKAAISDETSKIGESFWKANEAAGNDAVELMKRNGVKVVTPDIEAFRKATLPVYDKIGEKWPPGFLDKFRASIAR